METKLWDVFIAGGGFGGVAAALRAAAMGCSVFLVEENKWLGGQVASQGLSALDEHKLMDVFGGTALYYDFRERIRRYYRAHYKLSTKAKDSNNFNPGSSVEPRRFAFEPIAGVRVLNSMLAPFIASGKLTIAKPARVERVYKEEGEITEAAVRDIHTAKVTKIRAKMFIDATELGDLLPLAGVAYNTGVEAFSQTHEPSAPEQSEPRACQAYGFTFALEYKPGSVNTVEKPALYDEMKKKYRFGLCGMSMLEGASPGKFFKYRQIIDAQNFDDPKMSHNITLLNCACTDYKEDTIIGRQTRTVEKHLYRARQLALSYLYWLQTQAPREDGGKGYPELCLRKDLMGTSDGLSQSPYIREARRMKSLYIIKEQDVVANYNHIQNRARFFHDSIGIGWYRYSDIHWCSYTKQRLGSGQMLLPFQIPMGAIITDMVPNFIAGAKNIGATHISNGALRYHPIEWNIGESAGALAAYAARTGKSPADVYKDKHALRDYQLELLSNGIPLYWFDDVPHDHEAFASVQYLALEGIINGVSAHLHFKPKEHVGEATAKEWLKRASKRYGREKINDEAFQNKQLTKAKFAQLLFNMIRN